LATEPRAARVASVRDAAEAAAIIDSMPSETPPSREVVRRERSRIVAFLTARGARDVRVFGSIARGEDDDRSDIDLLVDLAGDRSRGGELLAVLGLSEELSDLLDARVDVVTPRTLRPEVRELALAEAKPL
jgi:hypothetical protein